MIELQDIQYRQYEFPYHHIPHLDERGEGHRIRTLKWGFEYLLYTNHIASMIGSFSPSSVLDVGCGDGYLLGNLGNIPQRVGVDLNSHALSFARAFFPDVEFRNCDVSEISENFDVVCAIEVLEHVPDDAVSNFLQTITARLKPGGVLLISVPTKNMPLNPKHFRHYDTNLLRRQLEELLPDMSIEHEQFFYKRTFVENLYKAATQNPLIRGEIPLLRGYVWRHAKRQASAADLSNGLHLIAVLRKR